MKHHILIVDDDEMIRSMVAFLAADAPMVRTTQVGTGRDMHAVLQRDKVDLLILDLGLPDEDGLVLARQVRSNSKIPIIVLTGEQSNRVLISALELGVNDFIRKPFDPYELQLRIKNQLLYFRGERRKSPRKQRRGIRFGTFTLNTENRTLKTDSEQSIHLTPTEFNILEALLRRPNMAFSRNEILDVIAKSDEVQSDRAVDVFIAQLRRKIEKNPKQPALIKTVRGFGYLLNK